MSLLAKAEKKKVENATDKVTKGENERLQGSYTDHHSSAYQDRMAREPMYGKELERFNKILEKLGKQYGEESSMKDLIEYGIDDRVFHVDKKGMLRLGDGGYE